MTRSVDHARLLAEIDAEVRDRRRSGDLPADFEQRMDELFARLVPLDALGGDFDQVLSRAEQSTFIDVVAPLMGSKSAGLVKKVVRKATSWQLRHVGEQVSVFAHAVTRAMRLLGDRVDAVEHAVTAVDPNTSLALLEIGPSFDVNHWGPRVVEALSGRPDRVLHAEAGSGELVTRLLEAGLDAYGVEPREDLALAAGDRGVDIRPSEAMVHLRSLRAGSLGGLVLSGCVDRILPGAAVELAGLCAEKLVPGSRLVVLSSDPMAWAKGRLSPEADLALGRPLRFTTWQSLLAARGFHSLEVRPGPHVEGLSAVGDPRIDANFDRLNELFFVPASYAVTATRPD